MADKCRIVCDYRSKRRPFTVTDAARVFCYAKRDTFEQVGFIQKFKDEVKERCGEFEEQDCDCEKLRILVRNLETTLAVALAALALAIPITAVVSRGIVLRTIKQIALPKADQAVIQGIPKAKKTLEDTSRVLEGEFRVLQEETRVLTGRDPGFIIKEPR